MVLPIWMIFLTNCLEKKVDSTEPEVLAEEADLEVPENLAVVFGGVHEERGQNIETEVPISFEEAVFGCDKRFTLSSSDGKSQNFEVHIPAGIANGQSVRLKGKGQKGYNGKDGDLLIKVKVGEKSGYERKGQDVYTTVKIPYTTAVLGGEIKIHTLYGDVVCKIKPGTQSGAKKSD